MVGDQIKHTLPCWAASGKNVKTERKKQVKQNQQSKKTCNNKMKQQLLGNSAGDLFGDR